MAVWNTTAYEHDPRWTAVDAYGVSHLHPKNRPYAAALDTTLEDIRDSGLPDDSTYPAFGKFLALQCRMARAQNVLEVGLLGGYTAIWIAALNPNIHITTLEIDAYNAKVARRNMDKAGVSHQIEIVVGPALETLPKIEAEVHGSQRPQFDYVFIDADKENNWAYMDKAIGISKPSSAIVVDNVIRRANIVNEAVLHEGPVEGARRCIENAAKDERVEGCLMQTVSEKNYDGFLFAVVK